MVGDQHQLLRLGESIDAEFVEHALDARQYVVVNDRQIRRGHDDIARAYRVKPAGAGDDFLWARHGPVLGKDRAVASDSHTNKVRWVGDVAGIDAYSKSCTLGMHLRPDP